MKRVALVLTILLTPHLAFAECYWDKDLKRWWSPGHQGLFDDGNKFLLRARKCEAREKALTTTLNEYKNKPPTVKVVKPQENVWKWVAIASTFFIVGAAAGGYTVHELRK